MLVSPILMLFLAGIFDFGMLFRSWEVVTNAAREGARVGSLPAYSDPANVVLRVEQYMQASGIAATCTACNASSACSVCVQTQTLTTGGISFSVRSVSVTSVQNLPSLSWVSTLFGAGFGTVPVGSTAVMRTEAPALAGS